MKEVDQIAVKQTIVGLQASLKELLCVRNRIESDLAILQQYETVNRKPIYAAPGILVSPHLAKLIEDYRKSFVMSASDE